MKFLYLCRFLVWKAVAALYAFDQRHLHFRYTAFTRFIYRLWPDGYVRPLLVSAAPASEPVFIPHPLCTGDTKVMEAFFTTRKEDRQTISAYVRKSGNPRLAASYLVREASGGLGRGDVDVASKLWDIANELGSQKGNE
jgi:hypothetical protein